MRIERIDETTVKLFITYGDIESRGFKREDLWTNRKRGEEFFWTMMEEINEEEDFVVEGPLWIQVHAFEKGVEVTISKSKNEDIMNMAEDSTNEQLEYQVNELLSQSMDSEERLDNMFQQGERQANEDQAQQTKKKRPVSRAIVVKFDDLESVINYAHHHDLKVEAFEDLLYMIDNTYYYFVQFDDRVDEDVINDFYGQLLEFANPTDRSQYYLDDYGKIIMSYNVTEQVKRYFKA
ncbi:adaptor protein MecA [Staphylococcus massiliensis]|uniref:Adapter protein MecA n=1 Tax=Staphylococcus massiliensis S46 TaxID=1229783 RepID=K9AZV4_9STAP|nr:adaptor protein MecA [Staphylococcus massiliensis]EKU48092.1 adaptor protein [Staphylococcus massiliensis S46]MCG3399972.1 adaptor protein MecA [Staphylococcus massiliensis]MCG3401599.1 adaptor protein MecA [Staphylococcus massiliensis]MCG3412133.1 adaptor protein MecA [Staphylococcus massiliensis]PNZ97514.1 adaptor protein MecA [Staphylococcus massiliensis CCUG 55927]